MLLSSCTVFMAKVSSPVVNFEMIHSHQMKKYFLKMFYFFSVLLNYEGILRS